MSLPSHFACPTRLATLTLILAAPLASIGQTAPPTSPTAPTPTTASSWVQLEGTFQNELKKIHVPLISAYVNDLQRLAATSSNAETTVAIEKELQYLQTVISAGGVIDLTELASGLTNGASKQRATPPTLRQATNALLVFTPVQATSISPPTAADTTDDSIAFTNLTWLIEALPKGRYEIIAQCSVAALPTPSDLELSIGRTRTTFSLEKRHIAQTPDSFRLFKLGTIELAIDVKDTQLEFSAPKDSLIKFRQLLITQAKPEPPKAAPPPSP